MGIDLAILLATIGGSLLLCTIVIFSNTVTKTKNAKLEVEVSSLTKRLQLEKIKNQELTATLEEIRKTGKIPQRVIDNTYEYQNIKSQNPDSKLEKLREKFQVKLSMQDDKDLSKEEIVNFMRSHHQQMDKNKDQNK